MSEDIFKRKLNNNKEVFLNNYMSASFIHKYFISQCEWTYFISFYEEITTRY